MSELCKYLTPNTGRKFCHRVTGGSLCYIHRVGPVEFTIRGTTPANDAEWLKRFRNELRRTAKLTCRSFSEAVAQCPERLISTDACKTLNGPWPSQWCSRCRAIRILDQEKRGVFT